MVNERQKLNKTTKWIQILYKSDTRSTDQKGTDLWFFNELTGTDN